MPQAACYVLHERFDDFFDQALRLRPAVVFLEHATLRYTDHGLYTRMTGYVVAGWHHSGMLHAVRLIVDDLSLIRPNPAEIQAVVAQRAAAAADILARHCAQQALHVERGMLLVAGLHADLLQLDTAHQLWHLEYGEINTPLSWHLRPGPR